MSEVNMVSVWRGSFRATSGCLRLHRNIILRFELEVLVSTESVGPFFLLRIFYSLASTVGLNFNQLTTLILSKSCFNHRLSNRL